MGGRGDLELIGFRRDFYSCLRRWGDALFELADAALCSAGAISSVPALTVAGGYRVVGVATDWGRFCELVAEARTAAGEGEAERADELLAEALRHVRGAPFEGAHPGAFGWALDTGLVHQMTSAIVDAAHRLSEHRLAAGDPVGATVAARLGQRAAPDEFVLWRDLFAVARAQGDPSALARLSAESTGALGAELARALSEGRTPFAA